MYTREKKELAPLYNRILYMVAEYQKYYIIILKGFFFSSPPVALILYIYIHFSSMYAHCKKL